MKLRLQLASMVSAPVNPGPTEARGKSAFGAAMQELMATPLSGKPSPPGTGQALVGTQSQVKNPESGITVKQAIPLEKAGNSTWYTERLRSERLSPAVPDEQITLPGEPLQDPGVQQSKTAPVSEKSSADQKFQDTILEKPLIQDAIIREQPQMLPRRGEQSRESLAGAVSHLSGVGKDASSRTRHEAAGVKGEGGQPAAAGQLSNVPVVPQVVPVAVPMEQPESAPATSAPKAESARVPNASRRAFVHRWLPALAICGVVQIQFQDS